MNIQVKEIPNFEDEEELTERTDIEKYPTKKSELGRKAQKKKPFEMEKNKIDEFEEDFEDEGGEGN